MPPRRRLAKNRGYPTGWRWKHGAWRYMVPRGLEYLWDGKREFTLGRTQNEAYTTWSERIQLQRESRTVADLLDRYAEQVVPGKSHRTRESILAGIRRLRAVFGRMLITELRPVHAYEYLDRRKAHPVSANRDIEVLSHAYTMAIRWGLTEVHPIKHKVTAHSEKPRDRYVTDAELAEALKAATPIILAYVRLKLLTGLRRGDLLRLRAQDCRDDGIHVQPRKTARTTGKMLVIEWTEELRDAVKQAQATRPKDIAPWIFCTRRGAPYVKDDGTANAFDSLWSRFMARALKTTGLKERFQERDLRAKTASDIPLALASALLGHADQKITQRVYRRLPDRVKPAK